jgi:hypothetical protein
MGVVGIGTSFDESHVGERYRWFTAPIFTAPIRRLEKSVTSHSESIPSLPRTCPQRTNPARCQNLGRRVGKRRAVRMISRMDARVNDGVGRSSTEEALQAPPTGQLMQSDWSGAITYLSRHALEPTCPTRLVP